MQTQNIGIDFIAYDTDGSVVLLAEAKTQFGESEVWAAQLRRNMLAHGVLPRAKYFLIATPERMYGWKQENLKLDEVPPQFTIDAQKALARYYTRLDQDPARISPMAFRLIVLTWLTDVARAAEYLEKPDAILQPLSDSGLLSSLRKAHIEMNLPE
jgi:hypothetical protein